MDIDLCNQGISELVFDSAATTEDERLVAASVECLRAEQNSIHHISGLGSAFAHLTTLLLRNNCLGETSTACHDALRRTREKSTTRQLCHGIPPWIEALPASLRTIDVSYNHLRSFLCCTCAKPDRAGEPAAETDSGESTERFLRHACPLTPSLFFPRERFPFLTTFTATNNSFSCSVQESQTMENHWESRVTAAAGSADELQRHCAVETLDLSACPGLFALNPFALSSEPKGASVSALHTVRASATGVNDLTAVSALGFYTPRLSSLTLSATPICGDLLHASPQALSEFLEEMLGAVLPTDESDTAPRQDTQAALSAALSGATAHDLVFDHLQELAASVDVLSRKAPSVPGDDSSRTLKHSEAPAGPFAALRSCVYALLLQTVIPSLQVADGALRTDACRSALIEAAVTTLAASMEGLTVATHSREAQNPVTADQMTLAPTHTTAAPDWTALAAHVDPQVRTRVVLSSTDDSVAAAESAFNGQIPEVVSAESIGRYQHALEALQPALRRIQSHRLEAHEASTETGTEGEEGGMTDAVGGHADEDEEALSELFVPSRLTGADRKMFEELSREATSLQAKLVASQESRRSLLEHASTLREQLAADRALVRDQRQEVLRLRAVRDDLAARTAGQRTLLAKRRKEVLYGTRAIESKEAAERNRQLIAETQRQQRESQKRQRALLRVASQNSNFSVQYAHVAQPPAPLRKTRNELLREEAVQKRMAMHAALEGPLAYEPKPFRRTRAAAVRGAPTAPREPKSPEQLEQEYLGLYQDNRDRPAGDGAAPWSPYQESGGSSSGTASRTGSSNRPLPLPPRPDTVHGDHADAPDADNPPARLSSSFPPPPPPPPRDVQKPRAPALSAPRESTLSPVSLPSPSSDAAADSLPTVEKDLSALSLTELFEAAAAVRRKQMALQQLHQQWAPTSDDAVAATASLATVDTKTMRGQKLIDEEAPVNRALFDSSSMHQ